jgi:mannose-6-phosphate isomerase
MKLHRKFVDKPWGRSALPQPFPSSGETIGEVWFTSPEPLPLLAKYIFTSERLSIQVHPDNQQARARGLSNGKTECWYILAAEQGASLGVGLVHPVTKDQLRSAARDGSIEQLIHWRPVSAGDFLYVPAGTVHAIGAGITLLEFQQNDGETFRLYDYGRPRELHLDCGIEVARAEPYPPELAHPVDPKSTSLLVDSEHFRLAHVLAGDAPMMFPDARRWVIPIEGRVSLADEQVAAGECLLVPPGEAIEASGRMLIGAEPNG